MDISHLTQQLVSALSARECPCGDDVKKWQAILSRLVGEIEQKWPKLPGPNEQFIQYLAERLPTDISISKGLESLRGPDLFLAYQCTLGQVDALAAFDKQLGVTLAQVARRSNREQSDDFVQILRSKLLVGAPAKLSAYAGQGDLVSWVRVVAARTAIDLARLREEDLLEDDSRANALPDPAADPELAYLKQLYRNEFQQAFIEGIASISAEDRVLLKLHHVQGLSIDAIAALQQVHRATAARRLVKARDALLESTRSVLMQRLALGPSELESVFRLVESQLHVSLQRWLER